MKNFDLIIIHYQNPQYTIEAINSALVNTVQPEQILVIVNGSQNVPEFDSLKYIPNLKIIHTGENLGYAKALNFAFKFTRSEIVIFSNNDVIYSKDLFEKILICYESRLDIGVIGVMQKYPDGEFQHCFGNSLNLFWAVLNIFFLNKFYRRIAILLHKLKIVESINVGWLDGAFLAVNRKAFLDVDGFDENFFFYSEDTDFSFRVRQKGWNAVLLLNTSFVHYRGQAKRGKSGLDPARIKLFTSSLVKLFIKHLGYRKGKIYFFLEMLQYFRNHIIYGFLNFFFPNQKYRKSSYENKIIYKEMLNSLKKWETTE